MAASPENAPERGEADLRSLTFRAEATEDYRSEVSILADTTILR